MPLKWKNDSPIWIEQWPLPQEKLEALKKLVQTQLEQDHIEPSTSPGTLQFLPLRRSQANGEC